MRRIREVIVVEGRYDKNALKQAVDATVVGTKGFGVFSDRERLALLRRLAAERGVRLSFLTDFQRAEGRAEPHTLIVSYPGLDPEQLSRGLEQVAGLL